MNKQLLKNALFWGFVLWLFGYLLSIALFFIFPANMIGWIIAPFGIILTLWVLLKKIKGNSLGYYAFLAAVWTLVASGLDYIFIVKALNPADGYYKTSVYFYYASTFILPFLVYYYKKILALAPIK